MSTIPSHPNNIGTVTIKLSLSIFEQKKNFFNPSQGHAGHVGHIVFFGEFCFWDTGSRWSRGSHRFFGVNVVSGSQGHAGHMVTLCFSSET